MRLRTFGGLWIEGAEPAPAVTPRQLGLLALAAAAGRQGVSRDRVIGILWPDVGEEQARHTLSQTLYSLRRTAGRDLIGGTAQLRLDPAIGSDIGELRTAVVAGNLEAVVGLYSGRFLDAFYLPGAPEFERWVEEERAALEHDVVRALERLARQADQSGRPVESVRWWQRLGELDRVNARYALGHMRALAATGDRTGALTRARLYREVVHRELETDPDPAIGELERSLRALPPEPALATPPPALPAAALPVEAAAAPNTGRPARHDARWLAVALLAVALLGLRLVTWKRGTPALPFLAVGEIRAAIAGDSTRPGLVLRDMLATSLGSIEGLQVVANSRLVELMPRGPDPAPSAVTDAARRAGATEIIEGELSREGSELLLSLRRVAARAGVVRKGYRVRASEISALADSAAAAIARDLRLAPPTTSIALIRTASPGAYALYDEGVRAYYGYDAPAAFRLMKAALARDSNFAMAAFYVWHLGKYFREHDTETRMLPEVKRLALRAIERERLLIQTSVAIEEASTPVMTALAETLTVKYPRDPEAQILLGQVRGSQGDWAGTVAAYREAFAIDSAAGALDGPYCRFCRALAFTVTAYFWWDSAAASVRTAQRLITLRPNEAGPWEQLGEPLLRLGRRAEGEEAFAKGGGLNAFRRGLLQRDLIRWGRYEQVDRELIAQIPSRDPGERGDAWWLLLISLRDQGRLLEADTLIHRWRVANSTLRLPDPGPVPIDLALLGLEMGRPELSIRAHRTEAAAIAHWSGPPAFRARNLVWNLALAATAHAAAGDTAVVRRLADSLEILGPASSYAGRDARLHYLLRGMLLQREGRHAEAVDAFRRSVYSLTDGYTRTNLMMARSLLQLHRPAEAIAVLRPAIHGGVDGSNTYTSRTELHEAMALAFEQAGQVDSARFHWRAVESAWRRADPQFHDRYLRARQKAGITE
ncbi:MAG TPA: BTAD domain-containing putative transcriptional regulator [Gemmatimonadales bacterium]|nr:BTAD domain-containing putative transcriptional regulator [Gemmatimonadales bacterium]